MASALTFVDTNVLVYAYDLDEPEKRAVATEVLDGLWRTRMGVVSSQVLQEFYQTVTRKFAEPMSGADARRLIMSYAAWPVVSPDAALICAASELQETCSVLFWDALIVEASRRAGADRLLTEDLQHGQKFGSLVVENPFL